MGEGRAIEGTPDFVGYGCIMIYAVTSLSPSTQPQLSHINMPERPAQSDRDWEIFSLDFLTGVQFQCWVGFMSQRLTHIIRHPLCNQIKVTPCTYHMIATPTRLQTTLLVRPKSIIPLPCRACRLSRRTRESEWDSRNSVQIFVV